MSNETDFYIRPAEFSDIPLLDSIERAGDMMFPAGRLPKGIGTIPVSELESGCTGGLLWISESDQQVTGFALADIMETSMHLRQLVVTPSYGRRGIGRALVKQVENTAVVRGCKSVTLTTFNDISWNAPYYESLGYQKIDKHELTTWLKRILENESDSGLTNRVAMMKLI